MKNPGLARMLVETFPYCKAWNCGVRSLPDGMYTVEAPSYVLKKDVRVIVGSRIYRLRIDDSNKVSGLGPTVNNMRTSYVPVQNYSDKLTSALMTFLTATGRNV